MKILMIINLIILLSLAYGLQAQIDKEIIILHTNDSHGNILPFKVEDENAVSQIADEKGNKIYFTKSGMIGGFSVLATAIKKIRQDYSNDNILLLDGGDTYSDALISKLTKGKANIELMNMLGYDFMSLGNHDYDFGVEQLKELSSFANFPIRGANVIDSITGEPILGEPYKIFIKNNQKIGLIAVTYRNTPLTTSKKNIKGLIFNDTKNILDKYIKILKPEVDIIILLSHEGFDYDKEIAKTNPDINLIIGGHSHNEIAEPVKINNTWIVQSGPHTMELGKTTVKINNKQITSIKNENILLWENEFLPDAEINNKINELIEPFKDSLYLVIGNASSSIPRNYKTASPFDFLVGKILKEKTNSDASFLPGVGYGITINEGAIYKMDLYAMIPHSTKLTTVELTGKQILKTLNTNADNLKPENATKKVGGLLQTYGISWIIDLNKPTGNRVSNVKINGKKIEDDKYYKIATNEGLLEGFHGLDEIGNGRNINNTNMEIVKIVEEYIKDKKTVSSPDLTVEVKN